MMLQKASNLHKYYHFRTMRSFPSLINSKIKLNPLPVTIQIIFLLDHLFPYFEHSVCHPLAINGYRYFSYPRLLDNSSAPLRMIPASSSCLPKLIRVMGTEKLIAATISPLPS